VYLLRPSCQGGNSITSMGRSSPTRLHMRSPIVKPNRYHGYHSPMRSHYEHASASRLAGFDPRHCSPLPVRNTASPERFHSPVRMHTLSPRPNRYEGAKQYRPRPNTNQSYSNYTQTPVRTSQVLQATGPFTLFSHHPTYLSENTLSSLRMSSPSPTRLHIRSPFSKPNRYDGSFPSQPASPRPIMTQRSGSRGLDSEEWIQRSRSPSPQFSPQRATTELFPQGRYHGGSPIPSKLYSRYPTPETTRYPPALDQWSIPLQGPSIVQSQPPVPRNLFWDLESIPITHSSPSIAAHPPVSTSASVSASVTQLTGAAFFNFRWWNSHPSRSMLWDLLWDISIGMVILFLDLGSHLKKLVQRCQLWIRYRIHTHLFGAPYGFHISVRIRSIVSSMKCGW
jgi:hypothetical protein